jgi:hypothetical protein
MKWLIIVSVLFFFFPSVAKAVTVSTQSDLSCLQIGQETNILAQSSNVYEGAYFCGFVYPKTADVPLTGCTKAVDGIFKCLVVSDRTTSPTGYQQCYPSITSSFSFGFKLEENSVPEGDYYFQIGRFTSTTQNWSAPVEVSVQASCPTATPTPTPTPTPTAAPTSTPTPTPIPQPGNISLNEFVACAPGPEWVELYNGNDSEVMLTDWKIKDDKDNVSHINGTIGAKGWATFDVSNLNNDFDTVRLYNGAGFAIESKHYDTCISTQSWAKTSSSSWQQTSIVTKGSVNKFPTPVPTSTPSPTPSPTPSVIPTTSPEVLGESTESGIPTFVVSEKTAENIASKSAVKKESPLFAILAILLGIISLLTLGGYLWYDWKKKKSSSVISQ